MKRLLLSCLTGCGLLAFCIITWLMTPRSVFADLFESWTSHQMFTLSRFFPRHDAGSGPSDACITATIILNAFILSAFVYVTSVVVAHLSKRQPKVQGNG